MTGSKDEKTFADLGSEICGVAVGFSPFRISYHLLSSFIILAETVWTIISVFSCREYCDPLTLVTSSALVFVDCAHRRIKDERYS
jgi:hypothetical protein